MDVIKLIEKYYAPDSEACYFLVRHSRLVAGKALQVAERLKEQSPDFQFIEEAAMLHDIGIFKTDSPKIGCHGVHPYISHGYLGREALEKERLPRHALVCERHIGVGITIRDIEDHKFPIPKREMLPLSLEEKIICFADKFYTKSKGRLTAERSVQEVREMISAFGVDKLRIFDEWLVLFKEPA